MANYEDDALYGSGGSEFNKTLDEASSALDKIASKAEEADSKLSNLSESFNESGDSAKDAAVGFKDSAENIGKLSKSLDVAKIREYSKYMAGLNQALKEVVELSKESDQLEKLTGFSKGIDADNLGKATKSIDKLGKSNVKNLDKLNKELESLKENLNSLGNLDNLKIKVSHGGGSKPKKETAEEKLKGDLSKLIGDSIGGLGGSNKLVGDGIGSVLKSLSKSKELKNLKKDADKFLAMEGAASKGMTKMAGGAAALGGKLAVALPIVTAIVAALGMAIKAGQEYHKVNVEMARSLEVVNDAQSKGSKQALETANDLVDVKNQWTRIGEDLTSVFEPLFNLAVDFLKVVGNVVESVTDILDKTNDEQYTPGNSKFKWYSQGLEEGSGEPESKSLPVLSDIASSAKQSGFTNTSAANLAIGTYDAAMDLAHQYGQEASKVAQDLADAWLTGSDAAKEYGIVVNDDVLAGYMAAQGVDIVNVEITDAMRQYYRYQLMLEQAAANNSDAMSEQVKEWTQLGAIIDKTKGKLFSFDEVIQLDAFDPTIPEVKAPEVDMGDGEELDTPEFGPAISNGQSLLELLGNIAESVTDIASAISEGVKNNTQVTNDNSSAVNNNSSVVNNNTTVINNNSNSEVANAASTQQSTQSNNNNTQSTNENSAAINNNSQALQTNQTMTQALSNAVSQLFGILMGTGGQMANGAMQAQGFTQAEQGMSTQTNQSTGYLVTLNTTLGTFQMAATSSSQAGQIASQVQQMLGSSFLGCSVQAMNTTGMVQQFTQMANMMNSVTMMSIQIMSSASTTLEVLGQVANDSTQEMNELSEAIQEVGMAATETTAKVHRLMETLSQAINKINEYYAALNNEEGVTYETGEDLPKLGSSSDTSNGTLGSGKWSSKAKGLAQKMLGNKTSTSTSTNTNTNTNTNTSVNNSIMTGISMDPKDLITELGDIYNTVYDQGGIDPNDIPGTLKNLLVSGAGGLVGGMLSTGQKLSNMWKGAVEDYGLIGGSLVALGSGVGFSFIENAGDWASTIDLGAKLFDDVFGTDLSTITGSVADMPDEALNALYNAVAGDYAQGKTNNDWMKGITGGEELALSIIFPALGGLINGAQAIEELEENMNWEEGAVQNYLANKIYQAGDFLGATVEHDENGNPVPKFASGGIGTKEIRNATLFENDEAEAVIPLESQAGIDFLAKAMEQANSNNGGGAGSNVVVYLTLQGIFDTDDRGKWDRLVTKLAEALAIQSQRRGGLDYGSSY